MEGKKHDFWVRYALPVLYILAMALTCVYITLRVRSWLNLLLPWETGYLVGILMTGFFMMFLFVSKTYLVASTKIRTYIAGVSAFVVIYLSLSILFCDIFRTAVGFFITDPAAKQALFVACGFGCLIFVAVAAIYGMHHAGCLRVVENSISLPGLTKSCRMVLLTDLHIGYYIGAKHLKKVVDLVNQLNADLVVISGDLINAGNTKECPEIDEAEKLLAQLQSREGTFAVVGNHDPSVEDPDFQAFLQASQIRLLEDEVYSNGLFHLVGRTTRTKPRKSLEELCREIDDGLPVAVMDHDPLGSREAAAEKADLVLCGHTHKGQIFPLNLFVRVMYSRKELWGVSQVGDTHLVVSAGAGYFSLPMRIGSDSEIVCLDLFPEESEKI